MKRLSQEDERVLVRVMAAERDKLYPDFVKKEKPPLARLVAKEMIAECKLGNFKLLPKGRLYLEVMG